MAFRVEGQQLGSLALGNHILSIQEWQIWQMGLLCASLLHASLVVVVLLLASALLT
jgi:hypothetical protein